MRARRHWLGARRARLALSVVLGEVQKDQGTEEHEARLVEISQKQFDDRKVS
jgi:hypothetical protein